jgi:hypothetical protein
VLLAGKNSDIMIMMACVIAARNAACREHAVKSRQVDPRRRHQRCQASDEVQRFEDDVPRAVSIRDLQPVANLSLRREIEPLDGHRRATHVAREPLELLSLLGLYANPRM